MCRNVIKRDTILIAQQLAPAAGGVISNQFERFIGLDWQPDEMIVKLISYNDNAANNVLRFIRCDTIRRTIGCFTAPTEVSPQLTYDAKGFPMNTNWSFRIEDFNGALDNVCTGILCVHLEFLQYEKESPKLKM